MPRIKLYKKGVWWMLLYGKNMDCSCRYHSWQEAIWDLPHAIGVTYG